MSYSIEVVRAVEALEKRLAELEKKVSWLSTHVNYLRAGERA